MWKKVTFTPKFMPQKEKEQNAQPQKHRRTGISRPRVPVSATSSLPGFVTLRQNTPNFDNPGILGAEYKGRT